MARFSQFGKKGAWPPEHPSALPDDRGQGSSRMTRLWGGSALSLCRGTRESAMQASLAGGFLPDE